MRPTTLSIYPLWTRTDFQTLSSPSKPLTASVLLGTQPELSHAASGPCDPSQKSSPSQMQARDLF